MTRSDAPMKRRTALTDTSWHNNTMLAIGLALQDERCAAEVVRLGPSAFEDSRDAEIVGTMGALLREGLHVDLVKVGERAIQHAEYLVDCLTGVPSPTYAREAIAMISESFRRRKVKRAVEDVLASVEDRTVDVESLVAQAESEMRSIAAQETRVATMADALRELNAGFDNPNKCKASFGLQVLDREIGGMHGGRLYVVGARPATGKSAMAMASAVTTSALGPVLFCSYEMKKDEVAGRIMSHITGVSSSAIANRTPSVQEHQVLLDHYPQAIKLQIRFPEGARTVAAVRAEAAGIQKREGLRLVVVDYLQQMSSGQRAESRRVEVGQISRGLKELAMDLDVPVLALSQLNRVSEMTQSKVPTMAEMRDSGDIEQDADFILLMFTPRQEKGSDDEPLPVQGPRLVKMIVEKNRQGQSGMKVAVNFDGGTMRFTSLV